VASYLIEGRPSRTYAKTKALMHGDPALWFDMMDRLADLAIAFLDAQIDAGNTHRFETELMPPRLNSRRERAPIARRCRPRIVVACH